MAIALTSNNSSNNTNNSSSSNNNNNNPDGSPATTAGPLGSTTPGSSATAISSSSLPAALTTTTTTTASTTVIATNNNNNNNSSGNSGCMEGESKTSSVSVIASAKSANLALPTTHLPPPPATSLAQSSSSSQQQPGASSGPAAESPKKQSNFSKEMVGGCAVCSEEDGFQANNLVYCDGCDLPVHQACYGIVKVPAGPWFCDPCKASGGTKNNNIRCCLCPTKEGALKRTDNGAWSHVLCALYIPEAGFADINTMEPILLSKIHPDRYQRVCYLCEDANRLDVATYGAKMNCAHACKNFFHVTCAHAKGYLSEKANRGSDSVQYHGFCKDHFRKKASSNNNRKRESNNSASMLNSASDSSQDNDSRRNNAIEQDKTNNSDSRTKVLPHPTTTTTTSTTKTTTKLSSSSHQSSEIPTPPTNSSRLSSSPALTASKQPATPTNLGLTVAPSSGNGNTSRSSASPTTPTSAQKKKRPTKAQTNNTIEQSNDISGTTSKSRTDSNNLAGQSGSSSTAATKSQDIYDWPSGAKDSDKTAATTTTPSKTNRKKPTTATSQSLSSKTGSLNNQQQQQLLAGNTSYDSNKVESPNLSISTSPSPSSSTRTALSSSASSSSSSTQSSSTSPALTSPSMSHRGGSAARLESPLAHNSKSGPQLGANNNNNSPALNPLISTRINLDDPRPELKKGSAASSSSLLSTAVPMHLNLSAAGDSATTHHQQRLASLAGLATTSSTIPTTTTSIPETAQPTIPPIKLPVPQGSASASPVKPASKARAPTRSTKKKAAADAAANAIAPPAPAAAKPEPKPKASRSKKAANAENGAGSSGATPAKAEPKARKGKANAKAATTEALASGSALNLDDAIPKAPATSVPTKRKSRATSAESSSGAATMPAPAKRIRKKKTDTSAAAPPTAESSTKSNTQTALSLPANPQTSMMNHHHHHQHHSSGGPGPLMISTPGQNNPLAHGFNAIDNQQNVGAKYFSPMISPYTNYDSQMAAASSLSRSSLSRLFTSSSSGGGGGAPTANSTNQTPLDGDPTRAFDDLRDYGWSQLSKCVLEQSQQFDIPMLIGTLHTLRAENEKLQKRVHDLTLKREQLTAASARLDLPPQLLTQNLANSNPNFSSIVSSLTNHSPKGLPIPSPSSAALNKQPLVITGSYNHMGAGVPPQPPPPSGHLGPPSFMDRSSPLVAQTHSTLNNIKSSSISTPSPPINALMAYNSNRAGLTVNQPYMPNSYPQMNASSQINSNPQGSSFYARQ